MEKVNPKLYNNLESDDKICNTPNLKKDVSGDL